MCQGMTVYDCGHKKAHDVECDKSHKKGGLGNLLKYALFEEPCRYDTEKRRHRLCNACESNYQGVKDYKKTKRDQKRGDHRERRHRDGHERSSDRSHGQREHRRREQHNSRSSHSLSRSPPKESHSSHPSRNGHDRSSSEQKRGRSRSVRPVESMLTIDESAPLPPRPINEDYSYDIAHTSRTSTSEMGSRDDGSSINDFRDFIQAAERTETERNRARAKPIERKSRFIEDVSPISPRTAQEFIKIPPQPVSPLIPEEPLLPSAVYRPARADWKPQHELEQHHTSRYQGWRPASSVYSVASVPHIPEPPRRSSKRPQGSTSSIHTGVRDDHISWVTEYASSCSLVAEGAKQSTPPTSNNTTPNKARGPTQVSASTNTLNGIADHLTRMAREEEPEELPEEIIGSDEAFTVGVRPPRNMASMAGMAPKPLDPNCSLGKCKNNLEDDYWLDGIPPLGPRDSLEGIRDNSPEPEELPRENRRKTRGNVKPPMMHFTTYRDPNSKKKPPAPTPSSTGSQVFMNPRTAPRPPFGSFSGVHGTADESASARPEHHLPQPKGFGAHRHANQSVGNLSTNTRWSDLYALPPKVNTNIRATHNGKPVHVVNPDIVQNTWKGASGPSPGKVSQRPSAEKKSSSDRVKGFISKLRPQESEVSFGCADVKRLDSLRREQVERESKKSSKSSSSKSKSRR